MVLVNGDFPRNARHGVVPFSCWRIECAINKTFVGCKPAGKVLELSYLVQVVDQSYRNSDVTLARTTKNLFDVRVRTAGGGHSASP